MAPAEQSHPARLALNPSAAPSAHRLEQETDDIESDELLRALRLDEWFPTASPDVPIWWH